MIFVKIGGAERPFADADAQWINQQVQRRRAEGGLPCVQVRIDLPSLRIQLSTPQCPGLGGTRPPRREEQQIIDEWRKNHLNQADYAPGNIVAFLKALARLID